MLKNLLILSGFSTFVVIVMIILNIYHSSVASKTSAVNSESVVPIEATFDTDTVEALKRRTSLPVNLDDESEAITDNDNILTERERDENASASAIPTITITPTRAILP